MAAAELSAAALAQIFGLEEEDAALLVTLRSPSKGVPVKDRRFRLHKYKQCFIAQELVTYVSGAKNVPREEAVVIIQHLMNRGCLYHVVYDHVFKDDYLFFRWADSISQAFPKASKVAPTALLDAVPNTVSTNSENVTSEGSAGHLHSQQQQSSHQKSGREGKRFVSMRRLSSAPPVRPSSVHSSRSSTDVPSPPILVGKPELVTRKMRKLLKHVKSVVNVKTRNRSGRTFVCFSGVELVDAVMDSLKYADRSVAAAVGFEMARRQWIRHVTNARAFEDSRQLFEFTGAEEFQNDSSEEKRTPTDSYSEKQSPEISSQLTASVYNSSSVSLSTSPASSYGRLLMTSENWQQLRDADALASSQSTSAGNSRIAYTPSAGNSWMEQSSGSSAGNSRIEPSFASSAGNSRMEPSFASSAGNSRMEPNFAYSRFEPSFASSAKTSRMEPNFVNLRMEPNLAYSRFEPSFASSAKPSRMEANFDGYGEMPTPPVQHDYSLERSESAYGEMPIPPVQNDSLLRRGEAAGSVSDTKVHRTNINHIQSFSDGKEFDMWAIARSDVTVEEEIARGAFGVVMRGEWRATPCAIKQLIVSQSKDVEHFKQTIDEFEIEARVLKSLRPHVNIVALLGVIPPLDDGTGRGLVMELMPRGSLWSALQRTAAGDPELAKHFAIASERRRNVLLGTARGLLHLHTENVIHRDMAARNVLLAGDWTPKIADLGLARVLLREHSCDYFQEDDTETAEDANKTSAVFGPLKWLAPESIETRRYGRASDMFAFAALCLEVLTQAPPYGTRSSVQCATAVATGKLSPFTELATLGLKCNPALAHIIESCSKFVPTDRMQAGDVVKALHPLAIV